MSTEHLYRVLLSTFLVRVFEMLADYLKYPQRNLVILQCFIKLVLNI